MYEFDRCRPLLVSIVNIEKSTMAWHWPIGRRADGKPGEYVSTNSAPEEYGWVNGSKIRHWASLPSFPIRSLVSTLHFRADLDAENFTYEVLMRTCKGTLFKKIANSKLHNLQSNQLGLFAAIPSSANLTVFSSPSLTSQLTSGGFILLSGSIVRVFFWHNDSSYLVLSYEPMVIFFLIYLAEEILCMWERAWVNWADYNLQGTVSQPAATREQKLPFFADNWDSKDGKRTLITPKLFFT